MSELKIMVELDPEDRARLDAILAELKNARPNCEACVSSIGVAMQNCMKSIHQPAPVHPADAVPPATAADVVTPAPETSAEKPAVLEAPEAPAPAPEKLPTLDEVRRAVMEATRMSEAVKKKVKALVNEYAEGVTSMKPDVYPEFLTRLAELVREAGA